jgi:hypothetical protein
MWGAFTRTLLPEIQIITRISFIGICSAMATAMKAQIDVSLAAAAIQVPPQTELSSTSMLTFTPHSTGLT